MKQGWEIKTIGSICDIKTGKLDANAASENGEYPFFTCSQTPLRIDNYAYDCECVLVAGNGELNAKYYNGKFNAYQRTYIITTKSEYKDISVKYLYKFFFKYIEQLRQLSIGGVIKYIKLGNLTDAKLPIPPREEQERIVAELDCLSGVIEKKREQLKQLDELAQSIFYQMFGDPITNEKGWEVNSLKDVCIKLFAGGDVPKDNFSEEYTSQYTVPIYSNGIGDNSLYGYTNIKKVEYDSVTISGRGTIGYCAIRKSPFYPIIRLIVAIPQTNVISPIVLKYIIDNLDIKGTGGAIPQLTIPMIQDRNIILPPFALQQEFAEKIEAIEKQKELIKQSITQTEELFNSRMDYYFN